MAEFVKVPPPERRKRDVGYYSADELHQMLVDDAVNFRPLGGRLKHSVQWTVDAFERIAAQRRQPVEVAYTAVLDDLYARAGHRSLVVS